MTCDQLGKLIRHIPDWRIVILRAMNDLNGWAYESPTFKDPAKTIFIYNDIMTNHYIYAPSPQAWFQSYYNTDARRFCTKCLISYISPGFTCNCDGATPSGPKQKKNGKTMKCKECSKVYYSYRRHECFVIRCKICHTNHAKKGHNGRCPIMPDTDMKKKKGILGKDDGDDETKIYDLIAWDIESATHLIEDQWTKEFEQDESGDFIMDENNKFKTYLRQKTKQIPNLICTESVYTGEKRKFTNLKSFLQWATCEHNDGYNIFVAHNSSGYDSRLLFEEGMVFDQSLSPTMNGGRIMTMQIGKSTFRDSMLHLPGSLSALGKGFGVECLKGYFPHLLNQEQYYDYDGPLPHRSFFDLSFSIRSQKDLDDFNEWYNTYEGNWCFQTELTRYCENDVYILASIMRQYSDTYTDLIGAKFPHLKFSPWFSATCAGYVHKLFLNHIHHDKDFDTMEEEEFQKYVQTTWAVLESEEYYFCKLALRGGSTNIYCYKYDGKIRYKDIQSSYPSVQLEQEYPVGTPIINVFDKDYYPCYIHHSTPQTSCGCELFEKKNNKRSKLNIKMQSTDEYTEWVKNKFGFAMVDLQPPSNLYCPPIIRYDSIKKKCVESLEFIERQVITSVELDVALEHGYKLIKLYRFDEYKKAPSMWRELLGHMYILKMQYSQNPPEPETQQRLKKTFSEKFGIDLGDMNQWKKNPVLKKICKGPPTSAWGKHAETVDHPQTEIIDDLNPKAHTEFFQDIQLNKTEIKSFTVYPTKTLIKYNVNRERIRPNCHRGYLPCAVFVTAYGRLKLWQEKHRLGNRVLMCDTDSIIYIDDPEGYDIPEGDCLGDWETEDFESENGGIIGFRSCGPKSYSLRAANNVEYTKCKGVSLKRAHRSLVNFDVMDDMVTKKRKVDVPQFTMDYIPTEGIYTRKFIKQVGFDKAFIKGVYKEEEYRVYPYGYKQNGQ